MNGTRFFPNVENVQLDLQDKAACEQALRGSAVVYNLAADMGGMGFIEKQPRVVHALGLNQYASAHGRAQVRRRALLLCFFGVRLCSRQTSLAGFIALKESDAYPAMPEDGYGWEKLFSERMCRHFREDFGVTTRVARFHNVYGPLGRTTGAVRRPPRH